VAKPYAVPNNVSGVLTSSYVHGTDNHLHLVAIGLFAAGGGFVRVYTTDKLHWADLEHTGVSTNDLTGLALCTGGNVESDAAYTFPAGSIVARVPMGQDVSERIMGPASATSGHFFKVDGTTGKLAKAEAIAAAELPTTITPVKSGYVTALADDHTWWGEYITEAVGETVAFGELLYFDCSEVEWKKALASAEGTMPCYGMAMEAKNNGEACVILKRGGVRHDAWSWAVTDAANTKTLYVSGAAAGAMVVAPVSTTGYFSQAVGIVKTETTIEFAPALPMAKVM
jgi:hypothetical protein